MRENSTRILLKKLLKKVQSFKKKSTVKKENHSKKALKTLKNTLLYKMKYLLQKMLDNSEMWPKALLSSIEGGFQSKKDYPLARRADCSGQRLAKLHKVG